MGAKKLCNPLACHGVAPIFAIQQGFYPQNSPTYPPLNNLPEPAINNHLPNDAPARQRALDPTESFICEAPAGSGKTELLTQRILCLLARVTQPEAVLAITFTRKAAAEMRERLLHALQKGHGPEPSSPHARQTWQLARAVLAVDAQYQWQLLTNPNRLQLRTFDSLCARLTQALPLHSALGAQLRISDDPSSLYQSAVAEFLRSLDDEKPWAPALQQLLAHLDNQANKLAKLLQSLLQKRDAWLPLILDVQRHRQQQGHGLRDQLEAHLQQVATDQVALLQSLIPAVYTPALLMITAQAAQTLNRLGETSPICACADLDLTSTLPDASPEGLAAWRGLRALLLTKEGTWRKQVDKRSGFLVGENAAEKRLAKQRKEELLELIGCLALRPGLLDALVELDSLPANSYSDAQWQALEAIGQLLPIVVAYLHLEFSAKGEVDFIEIAQRARQALGDDDAPTDLALRLDHQIQHILVDEFQDTSASQYSLLRRLTEGWQPRDGRTLFCVGDAMQSIYSFRAADVGLFLYAKEQGLGHLPLQLLQLDTNFRSQAKVVDWVNRVFARAFPERNNFATGAVAFAPAVAFNPDLGEAGVVLHGFAGPDAREQEAQAVVALVQHQQADNPESDIAILVRNRSQGRLVMEALSSAGLRPLGVDMASLASHPVVQDLVSLACALLDPSDTVAWLAILRAPWAGLTLSDLLLIRQQPGAVVADQLHSLLALPSLPSSFSALAQQRLPSLARHLLRALHERQRKPLRLWLEGLWFDLGGPACVLDSRDLGSIERFWLCLEALQQGGQLPDRKRLEVAVAQLFAAAPPDANPKLQVMTIHKSKGLEFEVVILPGLDRGTRSSDSELILWQQRLSRSGDEQLILSALNLSKSSDDSIYQHLKHERSKRESYEVCRLVYVAATRAKRHLHLLAAVKHDAKQPNQLNTPKKGSALAALWPGVGLVWPVPAEPPSADEEGAGMPVLAPLQRLPAGWQLPSLPQGQLLSAYLAPHEFGLNRPADLLTPSNPVPRVVGSLIHLILADMAQIGMPQWRLIPWDQRRPIWRAQLTTAGLQLPQLDAACSLLEHQLQCILGDARLNELLNNPTHCRPEYPISWVQNQRLAHLRVDLLWEKPGATPWLVDYKTAIPDPQQNLAAFLAKEKSAYSQTMHNYRQAVMALGSPELRMGLYFVGLGEWVEYGV